MDSFLTNLYNILIHYSLFVDAFSAKLKKTNNTILTSPHKNTNIAKGYEAQFKIFNIAIPKKGK